MDLSKSIEPRSDQLNADDLVAGPITVTIKDVTAGNAEQPVNVELVEYPGRPYKPSKSMRRVLVAAWGKEAAAYAGRRLTLFRNPDIKFGRDVVGGIEIGAMSDLDKPLSVSLTVTRGKRKPFTVQPLKEAAPVETGEIPENVREQVARVKESGNQAEYLKWLDDGEAPEAIKQYARDQFGEK